MPRTGQLEYSSADRQIAELTLGRPLIDPSAFDRHVAQHGLGEALNRQHELLP